MGGEWRGGIDGDVVHVFKTPDTDYSTEHRTLCTTPHSILMIILHHLCVVVILVSIILLVCWLWFHV